MPTVDDQLADLGRQIEWLVQRGIPALAGMTEETFREHATALEHHQPELPSVLAINRRLVPAHRMIDLIELRGKSGFTTMSFEDIAAFAPTPDLDIPDSPLYLITGIDTGGQTRNVRPDDALPLIRSAGRTPLTLEEGLALALQYPQWLRERNCFEMLGSRAGDKRVTGIWVSKGSPRLGWCWGGNPHTWLGMASASGRIGPS
ncbi:DUF5701 family protein [Parasphingorhabdus pacifica]